MKLQEMYKYIHVDKSIGDMTASKLKKGILDSKKPIIRFSQVGVDYFKGMINDIHAPVLLSIFSLLFEQILLDQHVGCIGMNSIKEKEEKKNENEQGNSIITGK